MKAYSFLAGLGEGDGNRLFSALYLAALTGLAALCFSAIVAVHPRLTSVAAAREYFRFLFLAMRPSSDVTLKACRST